MKSYSKLGLKLNLLCICICSFKSLFCQNIEPKIVLSEVQGIKVELCGLENYNDTSALQHQQFKYLVYLKDLLAVDSLCLQNPTSIHTSVISFNLTILPLKGYMEHVHTSRNQFGETIKTLLSKLSSGDMIVIENIKTMDAQGNQKTQNPIAIKLK